MSDMPKPPFVSLRSRCFCQATEDEERVRKALFSIVGELAVQREVTQGYHGNPLTILRVSATRKRDILPISKFLWEGRKELLTNVEERLDDTRYFHVRLSKQAAFDGEMRMVGRTCPGGVVDISLKVEAYPASRENALKALRVWLA